MTMYRERKHHRWIAWGIAVLAVVLLVVLLLLPVRYGVSRDIREQSVRSVRDAVMRSAVQCYSVEGMYPPSLSYLEEHYGLVVNHDRYIVSYEAYASNMAPNVRVLQRGE